MKASMPLWYMKHLLTPACGTCYFDIFYLKFYIKLILVEGSEALCFKNVTLITVGFCDCFIISLYSTSMYCFSLNFYLC